LILFKREVGRVVYKLDGGGGGDVFELAKGKDPSSNTTCLETNTFPVDVSRHLKPQ
jgi:hypothetical protein